MELFNKKKRQFVQSFESQEVEGLRVYFNADSEKQSNLNMESYLGKDESNLIKSDPHKFKYRKEELLESQLKAMGINPSKTAHMIYSGPDDIRKGMIDINQVENEAKKHLKNDFENKENFSASVNNANIKVNSKNNNEKEIKINVSDDEGNKSTTKGVISKTGRDIHIHINLGSLPHVEKAMLDNQDAIKKLHAEYQKNISETKDIVNNLVQKMNEKVKSYSFSENFENLTGKSKDQSPATPAVQAQSPATPAVQAQSPTAPAVQVQNLATPAVQAQSPTAPAVQVQNPATPAVQVQNPAFKQYVDAVADSKKEYKNDALYFRGEYRKNDTVIGQDFKDINFVAKRINGYNVDRFEYENKGNYGVIKNHGDEVKIQNYIVSKENIDKIVNDKNTPENLKIILEKYKNKEYEKSNEQKNKNKDLNSLEMQQ